METNTKNVPASDNSPSVLVESQGASSTGSKESAASRNPNSTPPSPADELIVIPVGGVGRIGMNWTLYRSGGKYLLVDAGIGFPDSEEAALEADAFVPDTSRLDDVWPDLVGLVVTHGHEDHIGAIDKLWPHIINCPIYATPFASGLLKNRFDEAGTAHAVDIREFEVGADFHVGPFFIETISVTHSIPEPVALAITTPAGTIVHTGDWKMDKTPLVGAHFDAEKMKRIGDRGVLAMMCDSTNASRELPETSETLVREAFKRIFSECRGKVVISCFASNVARVTSAIQAANESGRQIALAGYSMRKCASIAEKLGYLDPDSTLAEPSHLRALDSRSVAMACTGTQGETRAVLARIANGQTRNLPQLRYGDTVVISARTIPGNEDPLAKVVTLLRQKGINVIPSDALIDNYPVHVSGHAGRRELREMYKLVRPRFSIPVHGTDEHIQDHVDLAYECGVEYAEATCEGAVISVSKHGVNTLGHFNIPSVPLSRNELDFNPFIPAPQQDSAEENLAPTMGMR